MGIGNGEMESPQFIKVRCFLDICVRVGQVGLDPHHHCLNSTIVADRWGGWRAEDNGNHRNRKSKCTIR